MKIQFYYTKDKDEKIYIACPYNKDADPPYKDLKENQWRSNQGQYHWIFAPSLHDYDRDSILSFIEEALKTLPEPSWEDEVPMLVTLDIQCTNVNYSYVE